MTIIKYCLLILLCLLQTKLVESSIYPHKYQQKLSLSEAKVKFPKLVQDSLFINDDLWTATMTNRLRKLITDPVLSTYYVLIVKREAERVGLDPGLILSIILVESNFNPYAVSPKGAIGLMQIMPFWLSQLGNHKEDLFDVNTNIRYGCIIFKYYLELEHQNVLRALARYNGSLGNNKYPTLVLEAYTTYWYH